MFIIVVTLDDTFMWYSEKKVAGFRFASKVLAHQFAAVPHVILISTENRTIAMYWRKPPPASSEVYHNTKRRVYNHLNVNCSASNMEVLRKCRQIMKSDDYRRSRSHRALRHEFFRSMLREHQRWQTMCYRIDRGL